MKKPASTRESYDVYLRVLRAEVGERQIDRCDARDVKRWFAVWIEGDHLARGKMIVAILKAILSFGIQCRNPGCAEFKAILSEMKFPSLPSRDQAPSADQVIGARAAAKAAGHAAAALAYALQFDGAMRQWDARGQWVPLSDKRPSTVIYRGKKWLGPHWSQVDDNLVLKFKPRSTRAQVAVPDILRDSRGLCRLAPYFAEAVLWYRDVRFSDRPPSDPSACPMVMEDLQEITARDKVDLDLGAGGEGGLGLFFRSSIVAPDRRASVRDKVEAHRRVAKARRTARRAQSDSE